MSRKDYEAIAAIIRATGEPVSPTRDAIARKLADYFKGRNPNFDREKFLSACGV